jgi:crotonobetainyl-CoA:carnitine CoA-transferase CaiB-like acyl-CoA transferase
MSATPPKAANHPPLLGEHTEAVLRDVLDFSPEQIDALRTQGVI